MLSAATMVAVGIGLSRVLRLYRVIGTSMAPTYWDGDLVLARKLLPGETPRPDHIVVIRNDGHPPILIKRIVAMPGDPAPQGFAGLEGALPTDRYIAAGDDPTLPPRRRFVGPVGREQIWGKVCLTVRRRR